MLLAAEELDSSSDQSSLHQISDDDLYRLVIGLLTNT